MCGNAAVREEGEADYRCVNVDCPALLQGTVEHWASRGVMNIEGLGEASVYELTSSEVVKSVADLYSLNEETLAALTQEVERNGVKKQQRVFGPVEIKKLLKQIENSKHAGLARVLMGLSIRFVGERTAELLAQEFGSMDAIMNASAEELERVEEVGPRISRAILGFFRAARQSRTDRAPQGCRREHDCGEEAALDATGGADVGVDGDAAESDAR